MSRFQLKVIKGQKQRSNDLFSIEGELVILGRGEKEGTTQQGRLTFNEPTVSKIHAILHWDKSSQTYAIEHKSKTNPTLLNKRLLKKRELLKAGDSIQMGYLILEYQNALSDKVELATSNPSGKKSALAQNILDALNEMNENKQEQDSEKKDYSWNEEDTLSKQSTRSLPAQKEDSSDWLGAPPEKSEKEEASFGGITPRNSPYSPQKKVHLFDTQDSPSAERNKENVPKDLFPDSKEKGRSPIEGLFPDSQEEHEAREPNQTSSPEIQPQRLQMQEDTSRNFSLIVTEGYDRGRKFKLTEDILVIGQREGFEDPREESNAILLSDPNIPTEFAVLTWNPREKAYGILASEIPSQKPLILREINNQYSELEISSQQIQFLKLNDKILVGNTCLQLINNQRSIVKPELFDSIQDEDSREDSQEPSQEPPTHRTSTASLAPKADEAPPNYLDPFSDAATISSPQSLDDLSSNLSEKHREGALNWPWKVQADFVFDFLSGPHKGFQIALKAHELRHQILTIGSPEREGNDIILEDPNIEAQQAMLSFSEGNFTIRNLGRSACIYINKHELHSQESVCLSTGDIIHLGESQILFCEKKVVIALQSHCLKVESGVVDDQSKVFPFSRQHLLIGRGKQCGLKLHDLEISRQHLELFYRGGRFYATHLSETNPSFINGVSLLPNTERELEVGDRIRLSSLTVIRFERE